MTDRHDDAARDLVQRAHHSDPEPADWDIRAGLTDVLTRGGQQAPNRTQPPDEAASKPATRTDADRGALVISLPLQPSVQADSTQGDDPAQKGPKNRVSRPTGPSQRPRRTLAEKINRLFETLHPPDRGPWSNQEVERWLAKRAAVDGDGLTISANYLLLLRHGQRDNPTMRNVQAIAKFFQVDPGYFLRDDTEQTYDDLQLLAAIRDEQLQRIALRAFHLDPEMRAWLAHTIDNLPRGRIKRQRGTKQRPETEHPPADADPE